MKQLLSEILNNWWSAPLPTIKPRSVDLLSYFDLKVKKTISVIGFRRVGKTFTLFDFAQKYGKERCVYINFEDERISKKTEVLSVLLDILTEIKGNKPFVLLMDEIQEIPNWSTWARRVNETTQHRLILSGSSSKLSSREIPTELAGQTITIPIFPLNWYEFLRFREIKIDTLTHAQILNLVREYLLFGGLPEIVLAEEGLRPLILSDYYSSFVYRDIVDRYRLRNTEALTDLLRLVANTRNFTYSKLTNSLISAGHHVSKTTVIRYMKWLSWSFFVSELELFSQSVKNRIQAVKKMYLIDPYFSSQFGSISSFNFGHLMEQIVFQQLNMKRTWNPAYDLFYWKDYSQNEVDFVTLENKTVIELIQVTYAQNKAEIPHREIKALMKAAKAFNNPLVTIVTWDVEDVLSLDNLTIPCIPLWKWLGSQKII